MKLNKYKVKIKRLDFQPYEMKSTYIKGNIMYLYFDIQFKSKDYKFNYTSGDLGSSLLNVVNVLKDLINDSEEISRIKLSDSELSIVSNLSTLDLQTHDSSITCFKFNNEYNLFITNPNGKSLTLILSKIQLMKLINFINKALHSMLEFQGKIDDVILEVGEDKFDYDQYEEVLKLVGLGKSKGEILDISWKGLILNQNVLTILFMLSGRKKESLEKKFLVVYVSL